MVFVLGMTLKFQKFYMNTIFVNNHHFPTNTWSLKHWCNMTWMGQSKWFCIWNDFEIPKISHENTIFANNQMQTLLLKPKTHVGHGQTAGQPTNAIEVSSIILFQKKISYIFWICNVIMHAQWILKRIFGIFWMYFGVLECFLCFLYDFLFKKIKTIHSILQ